MSFEMEDELFQWKRDGDQESKFLTQLSGELESWFLDRLRFYKDEIFKDMKDGIDGDEEIRLAKELRKIMIIRDFDRLHAERNHYSRVLARKLAKIV